MSWIKVGERLPEREAKSGGGYWVHSPIVWAYDGDGVIHLARCYHSASGAYRWEAIEGRFSDMGDADLYDVSHWMPTNQPEPPK